MKTIKIIDLLNKIADGEEIPKKIKYNDDLYTHVDNYCYFCEETNEILSQNIYAEFSRLNDEVEIIEEEKEIRKMAFIYKVDDEMQNGNNERFRDFINELIDAVNELKRGN